MKAKSAIFMVLALILVAAIAVVSLGGLTLFGKQYYKGILQEGGLNEGIDLAGGSTITFEAKAETLPRQKKSSHFGRCRCGAFDYFFLADPVESGCFPKESGDILSE